MLSVNFANTANRVHLIRLIRWITVAFYTAALPYVILVFHAIDRLFSSKIAANVPLFIIILFAVAYTIMCIRKKTIARCFTILTASAVIVFAIMTFETNPNKYIHIPEYVVMTWILHHALDLDYKAGGKFLLIFICAAMLGVVDELMQGIHPARSYGWKDMLIDASSSLIGIFTLMGINDSVKRDRTWLDHLKKFKGPLAVICFGALTAVLICVYLFDVQEQGSFDNVYPRWLLGCNVLFLASGTAAMVLHRRYAQISGVTTPAINSGTDNSHKTALLWIFCPLGILITMHALVVWVAVAGINFR